MPAYTEVFNSTAVPEDSAERLRGMPKVEIHVHLEGATDAETVFDMAKRNGIALPVQTLEEWREFYRFKNFLHFIEVYIIATTCMRTPEDFKAMVVSFLQHQAQQNIRYSEAFFSATLHLEKLPDEEIIDALAAGRAEGRQRYGSDVRFIPDISRELPHLQRRVLEFALKARDRGVGIGLGLGGIEPDYPPELFTETFAEARREGLHVVAHGGEAMGPESIRGALTHLKAERIGHGIRALESGSLVGELRASQMPIEVCPQSNYSLGLVERTEPHPIRAMVDAGLYCTLNSDDPAMFSTDLNNEYLTLAAQGFTFEELWQLNVNTLNATFLTGAEKEALMREWEGFLEKSS